jgi:hypothetical protein
VKKKLLIRTGYLGLGAIEQLTFDMILGLKDRFDITLAIENHHNNSLVEKLSPEIKYFYIKTEEFEKKIEEVRSKKKNIFYKIYYNYLLKKEKWVCCKSINEYIKLNGEYDLFIDYDSKAQKYAEKIKIDKKVVWQHTSLNKNVKRTKKRLAKYNKVVLICDDMKNDFINHFPELKEKFVRIYNFLDFERINQMKYDESELNEVEKEMLKERYCVSVARLDYPKDFDTLIEAFALLNKEGVNEKLYIVGEGEQRERLEEKIKVLGLENVVFLVGRKRNPYIWIEKSDMFLHSSKREGFPAVLLEALCCNKMIISSDCMTGPKEVLENGKNGELFQVGNAEQLVKYVKKYYENPELKNKFIENSKIRIKNFEKEKIVKEYGDFFDKVIEEK